jgi:hypothetical protein
MGGWLGIEQCGTYVEKVKLIRIRRADARGEEQQVSLLPRDLKGRELESNAWTLFAHGNASEITTSLSVMYTKRRLSLDI